VCVCVCVCVGVELQSPHFDGKVCCFFYLSISIDVVSDEVEVLIRVVN